VIPINPNDPPVLVVDCVTLLDIICAPENAGILGTFCTALLITGLAPGLELGCAGGNRRRYQDNPNIPREAQRIIDQYNQNYPGNNYIPAEAQRYINQYDLLISATVFSSIRVITTTIYLRKHRLLLISTLLVTLTIMSEISTIMALMHHCNIQYSAQQMMHSSNWVILL
jgi:hypothetical protein